MGGCCALCRAPVDEATGELLEYNENGEHPALLQLHSWLCNTASLIPSPCSLDLGFGLVHSANCFSANTGMLSIESDAPKYVRYSSQQDPVFFSSKGGRSVSKFRKSANWQTSSFLDLRTLHFLWFAVLGFADPIIFCGHETSANPQIYNFSPYKHKLKMLSLKFKDDFWLYRYLAFRSLKYTWVGKKI